MSCRCNVNPKTRAWKKKALEHRPIQPYFKAVAQRVKRKDDKA